MYKGGTQIRSYHPGDEAASYHVCLKTGDHGQDGEGFYGEDPDALGRIYVGPYLEFAPELALMLEDSQGVCGYALGALDSKQFFRRYEAEWRPKLCAEFPQPRGDPNRWNRIEQVHFQYHHPNYSFPSPYEHYPSHLHIDLLPRVQGKGHGRKMMSELLARLEGLDSPGVHLEVSALNLRELGFYKKLGFKQLIGNSQGDDQSIFMGLKFAPIQGTHD